MASSIASAMSPASLFLGQRRNLATVQQQADAGDAQDQFELARYYARGLGGAPQDTHEAARWLEKAAKQGHEVAQRDLALYLDALSDSSEFTGSHSRRAEALSWLRRSSHQGYAPALDDLGLCYVEGKGVAQDFSTAYDLFAKAAQQGLDNAEWNLSQCYFHGRGCDVSHKQAVLWATKASKQNHPQAQYFLGQIYSVNNKSNDGNAVIIKPNSTQSLYWMEQSAIQGYDLAQVALGNFYLHGVEGMNKSLHSRLRTAAQWFAKAAAQDNAEGQYQLGLCHEQGLGVSSKNLQMAVDLFQQAAKQGLPDAQYALGMCYLKSVQEKHAIPWLQSAAQQGHSKAQHQLARLHKREGPSSSPGSEKDNSSDQIMQWLHSAAAQGKVDAQHDLAVEYEQQGRLEMAMKWYARATSLGYTPADRAMGRLAERLKSSTGRDSSPDAQAALSYYYQHGLLQRKLLAIQKESRMMYGHC